MTTSVTEQSISVDELVGAINDPEKAETLMTRYGLSQEELIGMAEKQLAEEPSDDCKMV